MTFLALIKKHPSSWMHQHLCTVLLDVDSKEIDVRIQEFLKFMYLFSMKQGGFIPVSTEIDQIWHEYILQTREYERLCMDCPGGKFIHHQTISLEAYSKNKSRVDLLKSMLDWVPHYYSCFGEFTDKTARYWTIVQFLSMELNLSLQQINQMAKAKLAE